MSVRVPLSYYDSAAFAGAAFADVLGIICSKPEAIFTEREDSRRSLIDANGPGTELERAWNGAGTGPVGTGLSKSGIYQLPPSHFSQPPFFVMAAGWQ